MKMYPVIVCGGSGTRLWPSSRPSRPKQFVTMIGDRSLFQETVTRVFPLTENGSRLIVVAGAAHERLVAEQLEQIGVRANLLLEPEARGSAAAMAAAAAWTERVDPQGINAFVASDHHIPDHEAFREALRLASHSAAQGRIVTLGISPTVPSSAYGYIKPSSGGISAVERFIEKPSAAAAEEYIQSGYLWNSGNIISPPGALLDQLDIYSEDTVKSARAAVSTASGPSSQLLGPEFRDAPYISIDHALMEKTTLASVLEVDFEWSDLGSWDCVAAVSPPDTGIHVFQEAEGCFARAPDGVVVAALGVKNLGIIVEKDAVLVCDLSRAQDVKKIVDRLRTVSVKHLNFAEPETATLQVSSQRYADWLRLRALPIWATLGLADGVFVEGIGQDGRPLAPFRRARVQARQIYVFAQAGKLGWAGPWKRCVDDALSRLISEHLRDDGLCRTLLRQDGSPLDDTATVYDQAFVMLALASAKGAGCSDATLESRSVVIREALQARVMPNGAVAENGPDPYQSNCHMHLLEAYLAWEEAGGDARWGRLADQIVHLARSTFIDPDGGFLREFFDADWNPAPGAEGGLIEPGHQFEWAWLMARYGRVRKDDSVFAVARKLYESGMRGVTSGGVAIDQLNDDGTVRSDRARLWPQTEWLKASLLLAELSDGEERSAYLKDASAAEKALRSYLTDQGIWRDKRLPDGGFIEEPAPASSLYHIMAAFCQVSESTNLKEIRPVTPLDVAFVCNLS